MEEDNEFEGMDKCVCPSCGCDKFIRKKIDETSVCRVWFDKDGYHDDVLTTEDGEPDYEFYCNDCGQDCHGMTPENSFKKVKA